MRFLNFAFCILLICCCLQLKAHEQDRGIVLKGFIISYYDNVIFSPSNNKDSFISAINEKAFWVGTMQNTNDDLFRALKNVGDSITVDVAYDTTASKLTLHYFYCEVGFLFGINDNTDIEFFDLPNMVLIIDGKMKGFCSIWLRNKVEYLKAIDDKVNKKIRDYYVQKNYLLPRFMTW